MQENETIIRFKDVSFAWEANKPILNEASFSLRKGSKITLMGQNGSGKSTIFQLITRQTAPDAGAVNLNKDLTIAVAKQVLPQDDLNLTIREFFEKCFVEKIYNIDKKIEEVFKIVNLACPYERVIKNLSGGQQARLLLASALIQNPDLLLLDEPTNNLDKSGIAHLTKFILDYPKTCIVISHDADFLNTFTQGVLYLDIFSKKIEQYTGDYFSVTKEIKQRLERERMTNVRLERDITRRKEQANFFAQKGGHLRDVSAKMRREVIKLEGQVVELRREDKTIRKFVILEQKDIGGVILQLKSLQIMQGHKFINKKVNVTLNKRERLLLVGPNGIGKTTLLEKLASRSSEGALLKEGVKIGYYRQDFSTLDLKATVYDTLAKAMGSDGTEQGLRAHAAGFLLDAVILKAKIGSLSEGQKGLLSLAKIALEKPGLLILDEPTNHLNFRHIPIIAKAINDFAGTLILVSHAQDFVDKIRIDYTLDLGAL
ncbi:MAG: ATP-binding cassette domain-containing protein [bacterium]|nr:ATP-binding cassette domain-containing protein [bacterium]